MEFVIDESTGLPVVSENLWWRVSPDDKYIKLSLMTKKEYKRLWQKPLVKEVEVACWHSQREGADKEQLQRMASLLLEELAGRTYNDSHLMGDYPPKSL